MQCWPKLLGIQNDLFVCNIYNLDFNCFNLFASIDLATKIMITPADLAKSGTEHGAQAVIFCWAALNLQKYPELKWLFAVPNGGARDKRTGASLKAEGVKPGIPDMCLLVKRGQYAALWIELKVGKNKASEKQNEWLDQ